MKNRYPSVKTIGNKPDSIIFRVDASSRIGMGHIMRCFALAQEWKNHGGTATFISYCESDRLRERIESDGFGFVSLGPSLPAAIEIKSVFETLAEYCKDNSDTTFRESATGRIWLVLDGYHFDSDYQKSIQSEGWPILVIDDMAHLPRYHCRMILNHGPHAMDLNYMKDPDAKIMAGPAYALLRNEYQPWRDWKREVPDKARKILVTMGGADAHNVTAQVLEAFFALEGENKELKVILGPTNPHRRAIERCAFRNQGTVKILTGTDDMAELMAWADMAVIGAGGTSLEMSFMGLPSIVVILSDNQKPVAERLSQEGCVINMGYYDEVRKEDWIGSFEELIRDRVKREQMCEKGRGLVDGRGADRVVHALITDDYKRERPLL